MKYEPNPIGREGARNLYCKYYGDCLDCAISKKWRDWSCVRCAYRFLEENREIVYGASDPDASYEMPLLLPRKTICNYV